MGILNWLWRNKLTTLLLLILVFLLVKDLLLLPMRSVSKVGVSPAAPELGFSRPFPIPPDFMPPAPVPEITDRLVVQESHLSLLVQNVSQTVSAIKERTVSLDGYMVESNLSNPGEATTGEITVRIPQEKLEEALGSFRALGVKVVSENIQGTDVTDEYIDLEARLEPLLKNKTRFEELMGRAQTVEEILRVQEQIINLQSQIDSLRGRQKYLEQTAKMAKVTIFLSTDELTLPYAPAEPWRPEAIFKQAVRSLLTNFQRLGSVVIWLGVYSVIWAPVLGIIYLWRRRKSPGK